MGVAGAFGGGDSVLVEGFGGGGVAFLFAGSSGHEVGGDVVGGAGEEFVEFFEGIVELALLGVFHGDAIAEEGVGGVVLEEGEELVESGPGGRLGSWLLEEVFF